MINDWYISKTSIFTRPHLSKARYWPSPLLPMFFHYLERGSGLGIGTIRNSEGNFCSLPWQAGATIRYGLGAAYNEGRAPLVDGAVQAGDADATLIAKLVSSTVQVQVAAFIPNALHLRLGSFLARFLKLL